MNLIVMTHTETIDRKFADTECDVLVTYRFDPPLETDTEMVDTMALIAQNAVIAAMQTSTEIPEYTLDA